MRGTYALLIQLKHDSKIEIGKLGEISFLKGYYCYIGSAFGKIVNLENRINRHKKLNKNKKGNLRWHIDYFLTNPNASIKKIILLKNKKIECELSQNIGKKAKKTISKFGSSDCKCRGHFHYLGNKIRYMIANNYI